MNSGSYFTALLIVVFGITTFVGLGGSFFITGFVAGLIETSDLGSTNPFFLATGLTTGGGVGVAGFTSGLWGVLATTFEAGLAAGFFSGTVFLDAGLAAIFLDTGVSFFLGAAFLLATGFETGFLTAFLGADLAAGFLEAGFFLLAIQLAFF
ncbi:MAG: hypothetical protein Q8941_15630 [Bacteroidota bacterium]|nr:hypothetical protein [Bacteroidota bacterium]